MVVWKFSLINFSQIAHTTWSRLIHTKNFFFFFNDFPFSSHFPFQINFFSMKLFFLFFKLIWDQQFSIHTYTRCDRECWTSFFVLSQIKFLNMALGNFLVHIFATLLDIDDAVHGDMHIKIYIDECASSKFSRKLHF